MLSPYKGSSTSGSPASSNNPYLVTISGTVPGGVTTPVTVAFAQLPYTIADASAITVRTFLVSTSGGAGTINLPATPVNGEVVNIKRDTTDGNALTIGRNGKSIEGAASNFVDANPGLSSYSFQYDSTSGSWWLIGG